MITKQVHRIELIVELDNEDVGEWVDDIYDYNDKVMFKNSPSRIISSDTCPLDIDSIENKWIKDILNES
jgi:hypothetical protein|tara:strand:- start:715 stop:921 length:207 start_codon:yes stop_codon:yes gene_type:complete